VVSRVAARRGDCFLHADFPGVIRAMPNWIASESPTTREYESSQNANRFYL